MDFNRIAITDIPDAFTVRIEQGIRRQITNRKQYGISFCATPGGKIIYSHHGKEFISDCNCAILLPQNQTYMLYGIGSGDFPVINFYCDSAFAQTEFEVFSIANLPNFLRYYDMIKKFSLYQSPIYKMKSFGLLYQIFEQILIDNDDSKQQQLLLPAMEYLNEHITDSDISVELLAAKAHISVTYFRRLFKSAYALSPKQYILNARIEKSKEMLRCSHYLISAIANECGFGNECHFCRLFKSHVGLSPSEYRSKFSQML